MPLLRLPVTTESAHKARAAVAEFLQSRGCEDSTRVDILFAVNEACTNCILHAYPDDPSGEFQVMLEEDRDDIIITVRDYGCGMLPNPSSPGAGLGLVMIAALARNMKINHARPGTEVCMSFSLSSPGAEGMTG